MWVTPWSIGCTIHVVFGGRNFTTVPSHCNDVVAGCDSMLSTKASYTRAHEWFANQMRVCVDGTCGPVLRRPRLVRIPFAANQNLSVFCSNTKRTGCAGYSFHAPGVLCTPQVCGKLIVYRLREQCSALVYTRFYRRAFSERQLFLLNFLTCDTNSSKNQSWKSWTSIQALF